MSVIANLEPKAVMRIFEQICAIPHGSGNTEKISAWIADFAASQGFKYIRDDSGNVIIFAPATKGYENAPTVIIQGHMDMVCKKLDSSDINMETDGLRLMVRDGFIEADGTSLGADDGIAVAIALAVISEPVPHPPVEVVITVDEETGMIGAAALDASVLNGRIMLNIDSEDEGVFTVGCAGGATFEASLPIRREKICGSGLRIRIHGLRGGHSGVEIHMGRGNADILAARLIRALIPSGFHLVSINGGSQNNVIPSEAVIEGIVSHDADSLISEISAWEEVFRRELAGTDNVSVECTAAASEADAVIDEDAIRIAEFIICSPNGVISMSGEIEGLVKTSLNLGVVETRSDSVYFERLLRSSLESEKQFLTERLEMTARLFGAQTRVSGSYGAWEYRPDSPLRDLMCRVFEDMYSHPPKIEAIHAGVECGIFAAKLDGLDCVSYGPDLLDIHSSNERMSIESAARIWEFTKRVLAAVK